MKKLTKILSVTLIVFTVAAGVSSCKDSSFPDAEVMAKYAEAYKKSSVPDPDAVYELLKYDSDEHEEQIEQFIASVDEQKLIENWGNPLDLDNKKLWPIQVGDDIKYIVAYVEDGKITEINISTTMCFTVVEPGRSVVESWEDVILPDKDAFGNMIICSPGDKLVFESDGLLLTSYPLQLHEPYAYKVVGHLSGEELDKLREDIKKNSHIWTASDHYIIETYI